MSGERRFLVVGTGPVARALGRLGQARGWTPAGVLSRDPARAAAACRAIGAGRAFTAPGPAVRGATLILLAVADQALIPAARRLAQHAALGRKVIAHCAGAWPGALLCRAGLPASAAVGSLHPLRSFPPDAVPTRRQFRGTPCLVEGEPRAVAVLADFAGALGGTVWRLPAGEKALYHAAACLASGGVATVLAAALALAERCGWRAPEARALLVPLAAQTVANVGARGAPAALTGPVARGDAATLRRHRAALRRRAPEWERFYALLAARAALLAGARLSPEQLRAVLTGLVAGGTARTMRPRGAGWDRTTHGY